MPFYTMNTLSINMHKFLSSCMEGLMKKRFEEWLPAWACSSSDIWVCIRWRRRRMQWKDSVEYDDAVVEHSCPPSGRRRPLCHVVVASQQRQMTGRPGHERSTSNNNVDSTQRRPSVTVHTRTWLECLRSLRIQHSVRQLEMNLSRITRRLPLYDSTSIRRPFDGRSTRVVEVTMT